MSTLKLFLALVGRTAAVLLGVLLITAALAILSILLVVGFPFVMLFLLGYLSVNEGLNA